MPHRKGMEMAGMPQHKGVHDTYVDHNAHMTAVPGSDKFSEGKIRKMSGEKV